MYLFIMNSNIFYFFKFTHIFGREAEISHTLALFQMSIITCLNRLKLEFLTRMAEIQPLVPLSATTVLDSWELEPGAVTELQPRHSELRCGHLN